MNTYYIIYKEHGSNAREELQLKKSKGYYDHIEFVNDLIRHSIESYGYEYTKKVSEDKRIYTFDYGSFKIIGVIQVIPEDWNFLELTIV